MKKLYTAPMSANFIVESLMQEAVGSAVNGATTEAPERGGEFLPL